MHRQVAHPGGRQIGLQTAPMAAVVERDEGRIVRAGVEQAGPHRVGAHHRGDVPGRQVGGDIAPRLAVVARRIDVRAVVVEALGVGGDIGDTILLRRQVDGVDPRPVLHVGRGDVAPGAAAVAGHLHPAVVGADPQLVRMTRRGHDLGDHAVAAGGGVGDGRGRRPQRWAFVGLAGQVGADGLPE